MFRESRWRWLACWAAMLVVALATMSASAEPSPNPQGDWLTANGHGVVQIAPCGDRLCGRIVGLDLATGEPMPTDVEGRPQCGLTIISAGQADPTGTWHGEITDPRDGDSYQTRLSLDDSGNLRLRVFVFGIPALGATQVWHRFTGQIADECRMA
jgi:uncharacterized protein (DUF2147 family)